MTERVSKPLVKYKSAISAARGNLFADALESANQRIVELEAELKLRDGASERARKKWQEATGKELVWPDHADLCVWQEQRIAELELENAGLLAGFDRDGATAAERCCSSIKQELLRERDEARKKATVIRGTRLRQGRWHKDYIIGVHWLSAAYERICAGERECEVMADYGYVDAARAAREEK